MPLEAAPRQYASMGDGQAATVDLETQRFPFSIVWGPLCPLTCCCPFVGHMGIADSAGKIHDFNGSRSIGIDRFMVGKVWRYAQLAGPSDRERWDRAVQSADAEYRNHAHNICCDNCHHHAALALTEFGRPAGLVSAWLLCCTKGTCTWCG
mmetsp:Transcript_6592/g.14419  ORF Transcript_6592/g.14419 Transcript_6592/m.14419 type:complete len:151 (+) Transcript_6592:64-516(+)